MLFAASQRAPPQFPACYLIRHGQRQRERPLNAGAGQSTVPPERHRQRPRITRQRRHLYRVAGGRAGGSTN
jgi:hypothetical protein